jgi:hypothetical protein
MLKIRVPRLAQTSGLVVCLLLGVVPQARTQGPALLYPPYGPNIPVITNTENGSGAVDQDLKREPPPRPWNEESIWNMKVEGFTDNQARPIYQPLIVNQDGREILYAGNLAGTAMNPLTGVSESNGTSIIDVTNIKRPRFLHHIPGPAPIGGSYAAAGAQMARVCGGNTLPNSAANGTAGHWYLLRAFGNAGVSESHQIWDVTDPAAPKFLVTVLGGLSNTHKSWWECDTGIAYLVAGAKSDGWQQSGSAQHLYIFDLSNPAKPVPIRQFGLVGQQPTASVATALPCATAPSDTCYEGVTNPPSGIHGPISMGTVVDRVYMPYGVGANGVIQIDDRLKLINGCRRTGPGSNPNASTNCANSPTQADLLWPQISWVTMNPENGGHSAMPVFNVPIPEEQSNFGNGAPQSKSLLFVSSEGTANNCFGQAPHDAWILDIASETTPWPMATLNVPQDPGDFCGKGARFGAHAVTEAIYPPYYGKIISVSWFNAGVRIWDIRDPKNPKPIAYFIQAPNANTAASCSTINGVTNCFNATMNDYVEYDDRGYIYAADRVGSGVTILSLTGEARAAILPPSEQ